MAIAPVARLKKSEIVWLSQNRCKHGHYYITHFNCFLEEKPEGSPLDFRIGFFDLEFHNLKASVGVMFGYCIKEHGVDKIYEDWVQPKDFKKGRLPDKRVVKRCVEDMKKFDVLVTYYGCVTPGHKVLKSDLTWANVENLSVGDELIAFNEDGPNRKWELSRVLHNDLDFEECVELELSNGEKLVCTKDHPWLCGDTHSWIAPSNMNRMTRGSDSFTKIRKLMPVWETLNDYESGYLAGFFDGEGSIKKKYMDVMACQKDNAMLKFSCSALDRYGFNWWIGKRESDVYHIGIGGGLQENLRFMGSVRPKRLLENLDTSAINDIQIRCIGNPKEDSDRVISIKDVGVKPIMRLGTTSKTYIVNGYGSHNTRADLPYIRTKAMMNDIKFPEYGEIIHLDLYYHIRNKFSLHRNSQEVACETLLGSTEKTRFEPKIWLEALFGSEGAMDMISDHCRKDVRDLERLYDKTIPFKKRLDRSA